METPNPGAGNVPPLMALTEQLVAHPTPHWLIKSSSRNPLTHGARTTFVYRGRADAVRVVHFMARFPRIPDLQPIGNRLWAVTVELPAGARIEYKLEVTIDSETRAMADPMNPETASDPYGGNSIALAPGYVAPPWATAGPARAGALEKITISSTAHDERREFQLYRPPAVPTARQPGFMITHDGSDFVRHGGLARVLDHLITSGGMSPVQVALLDPIDRHAEYAASARHARHVQEIADSVLGRGEVTEDATRWTIHGASLGAVAALHAAWSEPSRFGSLVVSSGSFITALGGRWRRPALFQPVVDFMGRFLSAPGRPADKISMSCGAYEALVEDNQAILPLLRSTGAETVYEQPLDGHHWVPWRDHLARSLIRLHPMGAAGDHPVG